MEDANYKALLGLMLKEMTQAAKDGSNSVEHHQRILTVGPTPQVLLDLGMPQLPMVITGRTVDKVFFDHGVTKPQLERLYQLVASPKAVYKAHQGQPGSVVLTYEMKGADPLIVAVHPDKPMGGRPVKSYNNIASVYVKTSPGETIDVRWKREGLLLWEQTTAVVIPLQAAGGQK